VRGGGRVRRPARTGLRGEIRSRGTVALARIRAREVGVSRKSKLIRIKGLAGRCWLLRRAATDLERKKRPRSE